MTTAVQNYGPTLPISIDVDKEKYRDEGESFEESVDRLALITDSGFVQDTYEMLAHQRFLPAGRVRAAIGSKKAVTAYNCFVSATIKDSMDSIMDAATRAATTQRFGGGIGYDFSLLRPKGALIKKIGSNSSGPVSFMEIFNAVTGTIKAAGHRRGAQMFVLRIDHPDIEEYIEAKNNTTRFTNANLSVAITDAFMEAVRDDTMFSLQFNGLNYRAVRARELWDKLMRATWDWAEPGVIFIDRINDANNLWYVEDIVATNPCGEQPLPPNGACLLGSFNMVKYLVDDIGLNFDFHKLAADVRLAVRLMDNVIDNTSYPLPEQEIEAKNKRRMGLGVTGMANAIEAMGSPYGTPQYIEVMEDVLAFIRDVAYDESANLAKEKGAFPAFSPEYLSSEFIQTLSPRTREKIATYGIRNSHLLSIAPTGTISLAADNVSSGIEPVFSHEYSRDIIMPDGVRTETIQDYGLRVFGVRGKTAMELTATEHVMVQAAAQKYVDSAVSKTCNVGDDVSFNDFKNIYMLAWENGAKGCTTFRPAGKRMGILREAKADVDEQIEMVSEGAACFIDFETGTRTCE